MTDQPHEPILSMMKKLRSAVRTNRRLHLDAAESELLFENDIYQLLCQREAKAMRKECVQNADNDNTNLDGSGSGSALIPEPGASAGSNVAAADATSRGARLRLSEAMLEVRHRNRR